VIDEETDYILNLGLEFRGGQRIDSLKNCSRKITTRFSSAPARRADASSRFPAARSGWQYSYRHRLARSVSFGHTDKIGKRVIVLGGGNTAMDCCRTARRLGGEDVKVIVRSGFEEMKASPGRRRMPCTRTFRSSISWCEGLRSRPRQAHRRHLPEGQGRI